MGTWVLRCVDKSYHFNVILREWMHSGLWIIRSRFTLRRIGAEMAGGRNIIAIKVTY